MIEVRHKTTGTVLWRSDDDSFNGQILSGLALAEADFEGCSLAYACLRKADLERANFSGAMLGNAVLDGANLERAELSGCDLTSASLLGARLREAELLGATLRYAHFGGADLQGAQLARVDASMADLRANLRGANLVGADLRGANLAGANLQYADLSHADLTNANLAGANLRGARLDGAKIQRHVNELQQLAVATAQPVMARRPSRGRAAGASQVNFDSLSVRCPRCDFENRVPIDSHSGKVGCRLCKKSFYVDANGQSTLVAPPTGQVVARPRENMLTTLVAGLRPWHFGTLLVVLAVAGGGIGYWRQQSAALPPLPDSLVECARWVADAYASNDPGRIARLQGTGTRSQLDEWLGKRRPVAANPSATGGAGPSPAQIKVLFQDDKQGKAAVLAQWSAPAATVKDADAAPSVALYWMRSGDDWRFDLEQTLQKPGR